jgi:2-dehydropantoate 2-reductase
MCSLFRLPVGYIYHDPQIIPMTLRAFGEVAALARALGISVPDDIEQRSLQVHQSFPKTMYASMFHDLHKGRPLELESLSGYVVRKGRELGMPTPVHEMAYLALKPYLHGTPKPLA